MKRTIWHITPPAWATEHELGVWKVHNVAALNIGQWFGWFSAFCLYLSKEEWPP